MALTKRAIDALRYEGGPGAAMQQVLYDGEVPGFGLRVYPSGKKSFILRYRNEAGRSKLVTIGRYGVLTPTQARRRAHALLADVYGGDDPVELRRTERSESITLGEFADRWLEDYARPHRRSWLEDRRRIKTRIKPALGSRRLRDVTPADVARLHATIGKSAKVEANRVVQLMRAVFNAALAWQVLPAGHANPAMVSRTTYGGANGVRTFRERSRERFVREDEMPRLLKSIALEESEIQALLRLVLYTGCRKSEILTAKWEQVHIQRAELALSEGKEGGRVVFLSDAALAVLRSMVRTASPYLFPSPNDAQRPRADIRRQWQRVRKNAGLLDVTLHDLRRTVGAWMANSGASDLIIGKALGHSDPEATRVYARVTDTTARDHLNDFASAVSRSQLRAS